MTRSEPHRSLGKRLLALREAQGLSLRTLAERVDLSASFLSQVERDEASPSIASLERITRALGASVASLFEPDPENPVMRSSERERIESRWSRGDVEELSHLRARLSPRLVTLDPDGSTGLLAGDAEEVFVIVEEGTAVARLKQRIVTLEKGDALHALPHHGLSEIANPSPEPARLLLITLN